MKKPLFRGVGTAVITPFRQGIPDLTALKKLLENQLSGNIDAIILLGTTGEASTLTYPEREKIIQIARETIPSSVPLIIGTGSNSTQYAVDYTLQAKEWGADGVLAVTPYYNKGTKDGIRKHFYAMADIGLPLLLYNVPSRTGIDLSVEDVTDLAAHPFIVGIKEASQDIEKATALRFALPQEFGVYSGNDGMFLPYLSFGADGLISVVSNLVPRTMTNIYRQFQDGKQEAAAKQFKSLYPLIRQLFCETNPAPVKYAMSLQEIGDGSLRLPLSPISALHQEQIKNTIESLHLS